MKRKNEKDHDSRKSPATQELFDKQRKERNAARPKQRWVEPEPLTNDQIEKLTPAELDARAKQRGWTREA